MKKIIISLLLACASFSTFAGITPPMVDSVARANASTAITNAATAQTTANAATKLSFTSADITPANGVTVVAHGLGVKPTFVSLTYKCIAAEYSYSIGDEILLNFDYANGNTVINVAMDATNVTYMLQASSAGAPILQNKSTGALITPTAANWRFVVRAWK